jgi:putative acetyltransferase
MVPRQYPARTPTCGEREGACGMGQTHGVTKPGRMVLRRYRDVDQGALLDVWYRASVIAHPFLADDFLEAERQQIVVQFLPRAETTIAEIDGRLVGFLSRVGSEVGGVFVDPQYQGRGVGRRLMDAALDSRAFLELDVFEANAAGRRFYSRYGFKEVGRHADQATGQPVVRLRVAGRGSSQ